MRVSIQTREYADLATVQTAVLRAAAALQGVRRTERAWVDRTFLRISFQVKDDLGSPLVESSSYSKVSLFVSNDALTIEEECGKASRRGEDFYLGDCSITSANEAWFAGNGTTANVRIEMLTADDRTISATLDPIHFIGQPTWYNSDLRTNSKETSRARPPGFDETVGMFITLPSSPVYAKIDPFYVNVYIDTNRFVADAWRLKIFFNASVLKYVSVEVRGGATTAIPHAPMRPFAPLRDTAHPTLRVLACKYPAVRVVHAGEQHLHRTSGDGVTCRRQLAVQLRRLKVWRWLHVAAETGVQWQCDLSDACPAGSPGGRRSASVRRRVAQPVPLRE